MVGLRRKYTRHTAKSDQFNCSTYSTIKLTWLYTCSMNLCFLVTLIVQKYRQPPKPRRPALHNRSHLSQTRLQNIIKHALEPLIIHARRSSKPSFGILYGHHAKSSLQTKPTQQDKSSAPTFFCWFDFRVAGYQPCHNKGNWWLLWSQMSHMEGLPT